MAFKIVLALFLSVAFVLVFLIGSMYMAERPRLNFQANFKRQANAKELRNWADAVLAPYQTNADPGQSIGITNLPPAFKGLFKWSPIATIFADSQARFNTTEPVAYIKITYGAAAGHFGVILGPTTLPSPETRAHEIRYTSWSPGIWFFDGQ